METCIFCRMAEGSIESNIIYEDDEFIAFRDINPQAPVHVLIIPKKHIPSINHLNDRDLLGKLFDLPRLIAKEEGISEDGYRIVVNTNRNGGQSVDHLHVHVLGGRVMHWPPG